MDKVGASISAEFLKKSNELETVKKEKQKMENMIQNLLTKIENYKDSIPGKNDLLLTEIFKIVFVFGIMENVDSHNRISPSPDKI